MGRARPDILGTSFLTQVGRLAHILVEDTTTLPLDTTDGIQIRESANSGYIKISIISPGGQFLRSSYMRR